MKEDVSLVAIIGATIPLPYQGTATQDGYH